MGLMMKLAAVAVPVCLVSFWLPGGPAMHTPVTAGLLAGGLVLAALWLTTRLLDGWQDRFLWLGLAITWSGLLATLAGLSGLAVVIGLGLAVASLLLRYLPTRAVLVAAVVGLAVGLGSLAVTTTPNPVRVEAGQVTVLNPPQPLTVEIVSVDDGSRLLQVLPGENGGSSLHEGDRVLVNGMPA